MIHPALGIAKVADPPSWYDEVIDLTLDEARGLYEMGITVYMDDCKPGEITWGDHPFTCTIPHLPGASAEAYIHSGYMMTRIYYIPKENEHDPSE